MEQIARQRRAITQSRVPARPPRITPTSASCVAVAPSALHRSILIKSVRTA